MKHLRLKGILAAAITLLSLAALASAPNSAIAQALDVSLCAPGSNTFTLNINNTYFPLPGGQQWTLVGKEQGQRIGFKVSVLGTETFYSGQVTTRVVEEREWSDANGNGVIDSGEQLREVSLNYFAQTPAGTVCYFGEQVDIYAGGVVVSHEGSWRADSLGNAPGIFMPAIPERGMTFPQEIAPGVAEDQATIAGTGTVKVPADTFQNALRVNEFNALDGSKGAKFYAPGVGLVRDGPLDLLMTTP